MGCLLLGVTEGVPKREPRIAVPEGIVKWLLRPLLLKYIVDHCGGERERGVCKSKSSLVLRRIIEENETTTPPCTCAVRGVSTALLRLPASLRCRSLVARSSPISVGSSCLSTLALRCIVTRAGTINRLINRLWIIKLIIGSRI